MENLISDAFRNGSIINIGVDLSDVRPIKCLHHPAVGRYLHSLSDLKVILVANQTDFLIYRDRADLHDIPLCL